MLYLSRKIGESVMINDDIEIQVVSIRGNVIKLGFTFPRDVMVLRKELYERIRRENLAAAEIEVQLALDSSSGKNIQTWSDSAVPKLGQDGITHQEPDSGPVASKPDGRRKP